MGKKTVDASQWLEVSGKCRRQWRAPKVKAQECMRDKYVAAAVLYAWAAECYARNEEDSKAEGAAVQMYENLKGADGLCSDARRVGPPTECDTIRIFDCGEL